MPQTLDPDDRAVFWDAMIDFCRASTKQEKQSGKRISARVFRLVSYLSLELHNRDLLLTANTIAQNYSVEDLARRPKRKRMPKVGPCTIRAITDLLKLFGVSLRETPHDVTILP